MTAIIKMAIASLNVAITRVTFTTLSDEISSELINEITGVKYYSFIIMRRKVIRIRIANFTFAIIICALIRIFKFK